MRFAPTLTNMRQHPEFHLVSCHSLKITKFSFFCFKGNNIPLCKIKLMCYFCHINKFLNLLDYVYTWNSDESLH